MARYNLGSLPVRRLDGSLSGMVTDRDLVVRCLAGDKAPGSVRVGSVMTKRLVSVPETMDVTMAARVMAKEQVRRLPVTGQGGLVGYLTLADLSRVDDLAMEAGECLGEICAPAGLKRRKKRGKAGKIFGNTQKVFDKPAIECYNF